MVLKVVGLRASQRPNLLGRDAVQRVPEHPADGTADERAETHGAGPRRAVHLSALIPAVARPGGEVLAVVAEHVVPAEPRLVHLVAQRAEAPLQDVRGFHRRVPSVVPEVAVVGRAANLVDAVVDHDRVPADVARRGVRGAPQVDDGFGQFRTGDLAPVDHPGLAVRRQLATADVHRPVRERHPLVVPRPVQNISRRAALPERGPDVIPEHRFAVAALHPDILNVPLGRHVAGGPSARRPLLASSEIQLLFFPASRA